MTAFDEQLRNDRDQALADWGATVTHHSVVQVYDPATLSIAETVAATTLTAVVGPARRSPAPHTGARHQVELRTFLVATAALPPLPSGGVRRLVLETSQYEVLETVQGDVAGLTRLECRRLN